MNLIFEVGGMGFSFVAGGGQDNPPTSSCTHAGVMTQINTAGFVYGTAGFMTEETEET